MDPFPIKALKPRHAVLSGEPGCVSINVLMRAFIWNEEIVDTALRLDDIGLLSVDLADLAGKAFAFPVNPEDGYIDGSIFLGGAHHPVDVTALSFPHDSDGGLTVVIEGTYVFEYEGLADLPDTPFTFSTSISSAVI
ncbi:MAG: hypothetical protein FWD68_09685 [Alphaproteobacteria bacterium]|nr:hypothetical protein [Alphaproteobacteria bacterium]